MEEEGVRAYLGAAGFLTDPASGAGASRSTRPRRGIRRASITLSAGTRVLQPGYSAATSADNKVTPTYPSPNTFEYYKTPTQVLGDVKAFFVM